MKQRRRRKKDGEERKRSDAYADGRSTPDLVAREIYCSRTNTCQLVMNSGSNELNMSILPHCYEDGRKKSERDEVPVKWTLTRRLTSPELTPINNFTVPHFPSASSLVFHFRSVPHPPATLAAPGGFSLAKTRAEQAPIMRKDKTWK
ncbi:hypothetical protein RUM43_011739 [Polyplax serrata]|uniref:Uncharacterized protein n=1 Tax=Polyplax serrata TaxID=468196 RepID=A0AAN8PTV4_POLSC